MARPELQYFTEHAENRATEREVPSYIMDAFRNGKAFIAQGQRDENDRLTHYHIIRAGESLYYVGVERDNAAITVIEVEKPYNWFRTRLHNFDHMYKYIRKMDITYDPETQKKKLAKEKSKKKEKQRLQQEITEELAELFGVDT